MLMQRSIYPFAYADAVMRDLVFPSSEIEKTTPRSEQTAWSECLVSSCMEHTALDCERVAIHKMFCVFLFLLGVFM